MKIFLIRHGETTADIEDRYGGDYEDNLTPKGKQQTEKLANELSKKGIDQIFSSPRIRAKETAEIILKSVSAPMEILDDLRERNHYGILSGMIKSEAKEKFPDDCVKLKSHLTHATGGEDYQSFLERIKKVLQEISQSNKKVIAVLTHGQFIKAVFRDILNFGEVVVEDCGFAELEFNDGSWKIVFLSGISKK